MVGVVLDHEDAFLAEVLRKAFIEEELSGEIGVALLLKIGRIGEDQVHGRDEGAEKAKDIGPDDLGAAIKLCLHEVLSDALDGNGFRFNKRCVFGSAAEGFDAEGTCPGEEVEHANPVEVLSHHGEQGRSHAIHGRAKFRFWRLEGKSAGGAGGDAHGG
jgi:hypothetical protein